MWEFLVITVDVKIEEGFKKSVLVDSLFCRQLKSLTNKISNHEAQKSA